RRHGGPRGRRQLPAADTPRPRLDQQRAFEDEELTLGLGAAAAAIAAERAAGRQHAMAGDEDRQRVAPASLADGARLRAELLGELAIASRQAIGDVAHGVPDAELERRSRGVERQVESLEPPREIRDELAARLDEQRRRLAGGALATPIDRGQPSILLEDGQAANRAVENKARHI